MFILTYVQRLAILCGCVGLLSLVIIITVCFVCPICCINKSIRKRQERKEKVKMEYICNNFQVNLVDKDKPPPSYDASSKSSDSKSFNRCSLNSNTSTISDSESVTGIPLPLLNEDMEVPTIEVSENLTFDRGTVCITLQYKKVTRDNNKIFPQLRVDLKEAGELQPRAYGGRCNAYFKVSLYDIKALNKRRRRKSLPTPLHQFASTVVKKSQHPVFNESFFFPMDHFSLKKCVLKVEAWDQDSLVNDTLMGEASINLKDVATCLSVEPSKELDLNLKLEDAKINNGQLLLGLCYLPTAERMTVAVLKANNLKKIADVQDGVHFYVQAMAIYGGKIFERRKTSRRPSCPYPVFNEMLMFDVPFSKLDHVALLLAIFHTREQTSNNIENGQKKASTKDLCVGKVVIGTSSRKNSLHHWNAMKNAPRRQVIQWHELR